MKKKQTKKTTIELLDVMIRQAEKGPSGFWTDDYEGCGNPQIFPEFEEGLKRGKMVRKEHYLCPWNTAVMYGEGHGNVHTGCYHSCSIYKARYLCKEKLRDVLLRFKKRMMDGMYDCAENLVPLLTSNEMNYIEEQIQKAENVKLEKYEAEREERLKKADALIQKYPEKAELFGAYYGKKVLVHTSDGEIDFSPEGYMDIVGAEKFTYDDYIDIQIKSFHKMRKWFATCYHNISLGFKGRIERKAKGNICFERIMVEGMYLDGVCFDGKEDHVWMNINGFEEYQIGDCVSFIAEVYRYVKTSNGKQIDFGLQNPKAIEKIEGYNLPTDEDLMMQAINGIICETCFLSEQCNRVSCLLPKKSIESKRSLMFELNKTRLPIDG